MGKRSVVTAAFGPPGFPDPERGASGHDPSSDREGVVPRCASQRRATPPRSRDRHPRPAPARALAVSAVAFTASTFAAGSPSAARTPAVPPSPTAGVSEPPDTRRTMAAPTAVDPGQTTDRVPSSAILIRGRSRNRRPTETDTRARSHRLPNTDAAGPAARGGAQQQRGAAAKTVRIREDRERRQAGCARRDQSPAALPTAPRQPTDQ